MYRNTYAIVNLDCLKSNIENLIEYSGKEYHFAVVKANGYGHGAIEVAKVAMEVGVTHLAVAFLDEAISLRKEYPNVPILVLGYTEPEFFKIASKYAITLTVSNLEQVEKIVNYEGKPLKIHFKFNSGMNRLGFSTIEEIREAYVKLKYNPNLNLEGLFTHFATADEKNTTYYVKQLKLFKEVVDDIGMYFKIIHCQNSAATLYPIDDMNYCNASRLGIAMYGYNPSTENVTSVELQPALKLYSEVSSILTLKAGEKIGYGATYTLEKDGVIATVPIGYADGIIRANSGREVAINQKRYKIVGRVCMDQLMILADKSINIGDQVELIGETVRMKEVSKFLNTIDYEVLCTISDRVPRVYFENNEVICVKDFRYNK